MVVFYSKLFSYQTDTTKIKDYIESFKFGAPPHGGGGIGETWCIVCAVVETCMLCN